jgi:hypothetical protein
MERRFNPSSLIRLSRAVLIAVIAAIGVLANAGPSSAEQGRCGPRDELGHALEQRYAEVPVAVGLIDAKTIIEIFARADGETWTIVTSRADGISCIIGAGKAWQLLPLKSVGPNA